VSFSFRDKNNTKCGKYPKKDYELSGQELFIINNYICTDLSIMKKSFFLFVILFFFYGTSFLRGQDPDPHTAVRIRLREHVSLLASDSLAGRLIGTEGNLIAGEYVASCFADIGLEEFNGTSYFHYFDVIIPSVVPDIPLTTIEGCNIAGVIPGTHSVLKDEYVIIGAHYDHLGTAAGRPKVSDSIYNGADDNASGVAALLEVARLIKERGGLPRTVVFVAFDGEEQGLLGSEHFLKDSLYPRDRIKAMISLDMVGYYRSSGVLKILGTATLKDARKWFPDTRTLHVRFIAYETSPLSATDTRPFARTQIPTLHMTTGRRSPYHKTSDQADGIDYDGLAAVTLYAEKLVSVLGSYPSLSESGKYSVIHYVPDYAFHWGPSLTVGTNHFVHTRGALEGKAAFYAALGVNARFLWNGFLEFSPGIFLEHIGARHAEIAGVPFMNRIHMMAMGVPFSFRIYFPEFNKIPVGVFASATTYYRYYLAGQTNDPDRLFSDIFRRHEWGLGVSLGLRASVFQLEYGVKWGMTGLFKPGVVQGYNVKNSTQTITFSYFF